MANFQKVVIHYGDSTTPVAGNTWYMNPGLIPISPYSASAGGTKTFVNNDCTNRGSIYLKDIGQRNQLGGGRGIYVNGQDQYIDWGTDTTLVATSDVILSCSVLGHDSTGVIKANELNGTWWFQLVDSTGGEPA